MQKMSDFKMRNNILVVVVASYLNTAFKIKVRRWGKGRSP